MFVFPNRSIIFRWQRKFYVEGTQWCEEFPDLGSISEQWLKHFIYVEALVQRNIYAHLCLYNVLQNHIDCESFIITKVILFLCYQISQTKDLKICKKFTSYVAWMKYKLIAFPINIIICSNIRENIILGEQLSALWIAEIVTSSNNSLSYLWKCSVHYATMATWMKCCSD